MNKSELFTQIQKKSSYLCIGLDTDIKKIPEYLLSSEDSIFEFNKQIIDATIDYAVAYKLNIAFYEAYGIKGWESLQRPLIIFQKEYLLSQMLKEEILVIHPKCMQEHFLNQ